MIWRLRRSPVGAAEEDFISIATGAELAMPSLKICKLDGPLLYANPEFFMDEGLLIVSTEVVGLDKVFTSVDVVLSAIRQCVFNAWRERDIW